MLDYEYLALTLANLSSIPVRLYRDKKFIGIYHTSKFKPDLAIIEEPNIFKSDASVSYYVTPEFLFYGLFRVKDSPVSMVLGPIAHIPIDRKTAQKILLSIGESPMRATELQHYLSSIPSYPLSNFLQILCTFAYSVNGEKLSVGDIITSEVAMPRPQLPVKHRTLRSFDGPGHNTYDLEQTLLSYIEHGHPDELEKLYQMPITGKAGTMAQDALRQQKNLVIVTATLASRAAIRGGMDAETALTLSDLYIQKAEQINSYESLINLSTQMTLDFARRVADLRCGDSNRKLIRDVRKYILSHINERITTEELSAVMGRNRTYLSTFFKEETGYKLSEYITRTKIDEAKRLLQITDKPLKVISDHLGFSSQSHFQTTFKKVEGITPAQYRANK